MKSQVLVCLECSRNFECTKNALYSLINQNYLDFEFLLLGNYSFIDSFKKLFEIINFSSLSDKCHINLSRDLNISRKLSYKNALDYAKAHNHSIIIYLTPNTALRNKHSLLLLVKKAENIPNTQIVKLYPIYSAISKPAISKSSLQNSIRLFANFFYSGNSQFVSTSQKNELIKIVFFATSYSIWPSMQTLYNACINNSRIVAKIVHVNFSHENADDNKVQNETNDFIKNGYTEIIPSEKYDLKQDAPDIVIYGLPYSNMEKGYNIDEVRKIVPHCVYIPYGFLLITKWSEIIRLNYKTEMMFIAWKVFLDDEDTLEMAQKSAYHKCDNLIPLGLPRIDLVCSLNINSYPKYLKKISNLSKKRKIVLWNTHHSINSTSMSYSSWKKLGSQIIDYIKYHKDIFFLWRPHPYFDKALKDYLGNANYNEFENDVKSIENLYIDKESSYLPSFSVADIMLSDPSSLAKEYLFTNKPIIITASEIDIIKNINNSMYIYDNIDDISNCITNLINNIDPKSPLRNQYINKIIGDNKTESVGEKILEYIIAQYDQ